MAGTRFLLQSISLNRPEWHDRSAAELNERAFQSVS